MKTGGSYGSLLAQFSQELEFLINISAIPRGSETRLVIPESLNWERFVFLMERHQLTSYLFPVLSAHKNKIPAGISQRIRKLNQRYLMQSLAHTGQTISLQQQFDRAQIPALFLKGVVLSQLLYGEPALKNSIDIDILVPAEQIGNAIVLLADQGYVLFYPQLRFTEKQKQINYKISHHYTFHHPEQSVFVELHWKLINPRQLLPWHFNYLKERSIQISLKDHPIRTLCIEDYLLYLSVHGARHGWYNLSWLRDFSGLLERTDHHMQHLIYQKSKRMGLERCFLQGGHLSRILYHTSLIREIQGDGSKIKGMVRHALKRIQQSRQQKVVKKPGHLFYLLRLKRDWRYTLVLFYRLRTHHTNWSVIKLPDSLFFLYYPLRPVLWFLSLFKGKKRH